MSDLVCGRIAPYFGISSSTCRSVLWGSPSDEGAIGCGGTHGADGDADVDADQDETGPVDGDEVDGLTDGNVPPSWQWENFGYEHFISYPVVTDLEGDGRDEVIFRTASGTWPPDHGSIHVLDHEGHEEPGWPHEILAGLTDYEDSLLVGNIDGDPLTQEIIYLEEDYDNYYFRAIDTLGEEIPNWSIPLATPQWYHSALGDLNGDSRNEVIVQVYNGWGWDLYAYDHEGLLLPNWPQHNIDSRRPIIADIDNDGSEEVLSQGSQMDTQIHCFSYNGEEETGFPVPLPIGDFDGLRSIGDFDNDGAPEILTYSYAATNAHIYSIDGTLEYEWDMSGIGSMYSPTVGDVDQDGDLETFFYSLGSPAPSSQFNAYHHNGLAVAGWPIPAMDWFCERSLMLANLDNDPEMEIIWLADPLSTHNRITIFNHDGSLNLILPIYNDDAIIDHNPIAIGDLEGDGNPNIVYTSYIHYAGAYVKSWNIDLRGGEYHLEWPMYLHDPRHTNYYGAPIER